VTATARGGGEHRFDDAATVVLFDGVCNPCDASVRFMASRLHRCASRIVARPAAADRWIMERFSLAVDRPGAYVAVTGRERHHRDRGEPAGERSSR
jgi:predicted DCC family thiol-disulfide oxidoreductase YuxK